MNDFTGKKVLVTGASKGLGWVCAHAFAEAGAHVFATARSGGKLDKLKSSLPKPDRHVVYPADLAEVSGAEAVAERLRDSLGVADILLHCAGGGFGMREPLLGREEFETLHRVNLAAAAEINRLLIPDMQAADGGYVVHVGSTTSKEAIGSVGYNTVKAALAAYVRSLGRQLACTNVIVTGILPGAFTAPGNSWQRMIDRGEKQVMDDFIRERLPRGVMPDAGELLALIFLLTGPGASMMAGSCVPIDAGESFAYSI